jgi:predicted dehydrogenase
MTSSNTKHRIGVIGTGGIASNHVIGYKLAGAEVVALCDVNASTLATRQREWDIPTGYANFHELIGDPTITAVSICTPNSTHHPITVAAAKAGKHVLCEKPVSLDLAQAEEMVQTCDNAGVVFQVGHHMRSWTAAVHTKAMIERGDIGEISYARFRQAHDWGGAAEVRGVFGLKAHAGGGTLIDNGCHLFDLARYLGGEVDNVFARIANRKFAVEVEDTGRSGMDGNGLE